MFREINCITIGGEEAVRKVIEETPVAVFVNGRHLTTVILSPGGFQEFVTGYLYTEEIVRSADEIESVRIEDNRISVLTKNPFRRGSVKKTILSGCGGSVSYIDAQRLPAIRSDLAATVPEIEAAVAALPRSGRLETVALRKCLVANIPVLVSTDLPTALAVDVAKEAGLCLVGSAGTPDMAVFTHPERISGIEGG